MVEVFKTNVETKKQARKILDLLRSAFTDIQVNFDLDDCDRILRVEGSIIDADKVEQLLMANGYVCEILEYDSKESGSSYMNMS